MVAFQRWAQSASLITKHLWLDLNQEDF